MKYWNFELVSKQENPNARLVWFSFLYCFQLKRYLYVHKHDTPDVYTPGPKVIKLFHAQLSMKFQRLIKLKYRQIKKFLGLSLSDVVFIMLMNIKMPFNIYEHDQFYAQLS